jgi:hypothetical protein
MANGEWRMAKGKDGGLSPNGEWQKKKAELLS